MRRVLEEGLAKGLWKEGFLMRKLLEEGSHEAEGFAVGPAEGFQKVVGIGFGRFSEA